MPSATVARERDSQVHQVPALPSELLMVGESQWLFSDAELLLAPSIVDGKLSPQAEKENRSKGVNFILQAGIMLKLPQITLATASVFLHRFYMRHSMVDIPGKLPGYHYYSMAATCLFLATKVEENCRKMKELVVACVRVAQKDPNKLVDEQDKEYWKWRDNILHNEDVLLEALCFDLSLEAPYKTLFELLIQLRHENHKKLRNAAWAFVNDSCLTMLCLLFSSKTIAASAIYAAARFIGLSFPDAQSGIPWWESAGVNIGEVRRACNYMAAIYENSSTKSGREGIVYERTPESAGIWDDPTRDTDSIEHESQNKNGNTDQLVGGNHEEQGEEDLADSSETNKSNMGTSVTFHNERIEMSPRKRRRIEDEGDQQLAPLVGRSEVSKSPRISYEAKAGHAPPSSSEGKNDKLHGQATTGGLLSPKLNEGSEDGEVET